MLEDSLLKELQEYVDGHLNVLTICECINYSYAEISLSTDLPTNEMEDFIKNNRKPKFKDVLFSFIDINGVKDSDVYNKAGIDRRHFSKIRSMPNYRISKNNAIALALALELNNEETDTLLSAAGYSLSESDTFDLVIQFCLEKKIFDIFSVNQALGYFSLKPLGGVLE